jgi:6,7-dimethyl-8-ribityllumazine synthase
MASKKKNLSAYEPTGIADASGMRFGIVSAEWNEEITHALLQGTVNTLLLHGAKESDLHIHYVPGSFELPAAAAILAESLKPDAIICLGCIIQGETRHFEFIAQAVAHGITRVSLDNNLPVIFGVLTTDTYDQAKQRAGGKHGNKGDEAAITAIKMISLKKKLEIRSF